MTSNRPRDLLERTDADGWTSLRLNRPDRRNALSIELRDLLSDQLDELADDETVRGVVIEAAGTTFSAGWDLDEFAASREDDELSTKIWESGDRFHHTLLQFPLPLVAAIDGPALAGGFDLAICCDVRLATTAARFGHPEFAWADVLFSPLEALVGGGVARDLLLTGRELDADDALATGVISRLVPTQRLADTVNDTMQRIAAAPRDALMRTKAKAIARAGLAMSPSLQL